MSEEKKAPPKNAKIEQWKKNTDGWVKVEDGIFKHPDLKIYDVRVFRRIKVDKNKPAKPVFKRARNINSESLARKKKHELQEELALLALKHEGKDITWEIACEEYFARLENRYKDEKITFNTMDSTISTLKKHTTVWNELWLSDFTSEQIENFINSDELKKNENERPKAPTRVNILKYIRGVFKYMLDKGRIKHNPATGIYIRGKKKINYPPVMTHNEMIGLIEYVKNLNQKWAKDWAKVYTVAYLTGARSGELYSLLWDDVKWESKTIQITKNYDWKTETHKKITKGKQDRTVPMNPELMEYLLEFRGHNHEFVLPRIPDWQNGRAAEIIKAFQKGANVRETKFHGIRGTFITNLLLSGVPVVKVQTMCGHEDLKTTLLYLRMVGDETKGATDGLSLKSKPDNIHDITEGKKKTS
ncbi:MAG: site-specific integrase [Deltaproteobacteria bacterium]|jgi:integrase|nr:site-specific integrase [Deltaproteobacteria bacterium]